jgi:hypothetical protein
MSEFELRRRLQSLQQGREPGIDLWPEIAQRIARAPAVSSLPSRRRAFIPEALAAMLVLGVGALLLLAGRDIAPRLGIDSVASHASPRADDWTRREVSALDASYRAALSEVGQGTTLPPELRAAATELDAAQTQLEDALREDPDSPYLLKLLRQTHERRLHLSTQVATRLG